MAETEDGILWVGSNNEGFTQITFNPNDLLNPNVVQFNEQNGLPIGYEWADVYKIKNKILFSTAKGIYNYINQSFVPDKIFSGENHKTMWYFPIVEDASGKIWFSSSNQYGTKRETGYFELDNEGNMVKNISVFQTLNDYNIEHIFCDINGLVWFGGFDGLISYEENSHNTINNNSRCIIKQVILPNNFVININNANKPSSDLASFKYSQNIIRFNFTALLYSSYNHIHYQTKLEGFQGDWSDWGKESFKEYTNLPSGEYSFKVRAKGSWGNISEVTSYNFVIKPPIYYTWWAYLIYIIIFFSIIWIIYKLNEIKHAVEKNKLEQLVTERTNELVRQKEQTEKLVQKLLPQKTLKEIQETGSAKSQKYELVTVLFADIKDFTKIAEKTIPEELINYLNEIFTSFDNIISKYNIEKIKTIGDAYMCAGGMPNKDRSNPIEVVLAGMEMLSKLEELNQKNELIFDIRIGIHTGSVIAGVVGIQKLEYDIWGDTVNSASRMETYGKEGIVNVSSETFKYINEFFDCEIRNKSKLKYSGNLDMYFVKKIKKHLSEYSSGKTPNKEFKVKLQTMRLKDIEEHMFEKLDNGLPKNLYYHNLKHTINVYYRVEIIGMEEKVNEEELLLLKTAAIFHDAGFMVSYDNNEAIGAKMAEETLKNYNYTKKQINIIKSIILSTTMPQHPKTHLEMIMCDADLDYLGSTNFIPVSQNLFRELFERGKISTIDQWNRMQYKFIQKHKYFTASARKHRDSGKTSVLLDLKKRI